MATNKTNMDKVLYPKLSYVIVGILFAVYNDLGPYASEKQYSEKIEEKLREFRINYKRESAIGNSGNVIDFIIEGNIILELKAKRILTKEDYFQTQRYLQETGVKLALLVNFRNKYIKPVRILKREKSVASAHLHYSYH